MLLLIPSNICGAFAQNESCMPDGNCCCVESPSDDAPINKSGTLSKKCCCKADRSPAPSDKHQRPARVFADTSIDNFGPMAFVAIVAVELNDSIISDDVWRHAAPRAPPTAVYKSTQRILC